MSLCIT